MKDTKYEHLVHKIPNNLATRWLIKRTNKWMRNCNSEYMLVSRYRKPKADFMYNAFGTIIPRDHLNIKHCLTPANKKGKHISLYLRHRDGRTI
tara:strand:- start:340 stop:618 length:279 start_codon:yes stop_codon:yes gene_type:complete